MSKKAAHYIILKIGDAGCIRLHVCSTPSTSPSWTLDQPGTVKVGSGPRPKLRDRRDDEHITGGPLTMQNVTWRR